MKIFVAGASGRTGKWVLELALKQGHLVRGFSRHVTKLELVHANFEPITGDVLDLAAVQAAVKGCDAIISALGADDFRNPGTIMSQGMKNLVLAAREAGIKRIVAVGGAGVLQANPSELRQDQPGFPEVFRPISKAHLGTYEALRESGLNWTMVCTPDIPDGPPTGKGRSKIDYLPDEAKAVPTGELARFLIEEAVSSRHPRTRVGFCS